MTDKANPYADILHLPHHKSPNRPHMSMHDRAAQFSPFAALSGYEEMIGEEARLVDNKIELSEEELEMIAGGFSWTGFFAGIGGGILMAAACVGAVLAVVGTGGAAAPVVAAAIAKTIAVGAAAGTVVGTGAGFLFG